MVKKKYLIVVIERVELHTIVEASNYKEAYSKAKKHDFEIDERQSLNLPTQVRAVKRID